MNHACLHWDGWDVRHEPRHRQRSLGSARAVLQKALRGDARRSLDCEHFSPCLWRLGVDLSRRRSSASGDRARSVLRAYCCWPALCSCARHENTSHGSCGFLGERGHIGPWLLAHEGPQRWQPPTRCRHTTQPLSIDSRMRGAIAKRLATTSATERSTRRHKFAWTRCGAGSPMTSMRISAPAASTDLPSRSAWRLSATKSEARTQSKRSHGWTSAAAARCA